MAIGRSVESATGVDLINSFPLRREEVMVVVFWRLRFKDDFRSISTCLLKDNIT
jgi:hypothetical protein